MLHWIFGSRGASAPGLETAPAWPSWASAGAFVALVALVALISLDAVVVPTVPAAHAAPVSRQNSAGPDLNALLDGAVADFERGNVDASVAKFDQLVAAAPRAMPQLWQRGIAQYYAGRYDDCRAQFEAHRTVNPDDVENAAWHFLCVARRHGANKARAALLPVGPDARVPMRQVYELFKGTTTAARVLEAGAGTASGRFYANLYLGLFHEATGNARDARTALLAAANDEFRGVGGYMHMVARVHVARLGVK